MSRRACSHRNFFFLSVRSKHFQIQTLKDRARYFQILEVFAYRSIGADVQCGIPTPDFKTRTPTPPPHPSFSTVNYGAVDFSDHFVVSKLKFERVVIEAMAIFEYNN